LHMNRGNRDKPTGVPRKSSPTGKRKSSPKGRKKRKKKTILEDPKLVREMITLAESGDIGKLRVIMEAEDNAKKFDLNADAGEALVKGAEKGQLEVVSFLLESGTKPSYSQSKALHRACVANQFPVVRLLVDFGGDVNAKSAMTEYTPLHHACQHGHTELARYLIEQGAYLDILSHAYNCLSYNGWAPLHFAADQGHLEAVRCLLDNGAEIDILSGTKETPAAVAAEHGQFAVVKHLIAYGADIHAKRRGLSIVQWAVYRGDHEAVQYLVSHGAEPDLAAQTKWFPDGRTLLDVIKAEFSPLFENIDRAIYRGGIGLRERASHRRLLTELRWETLVDMDLRSLEAPPPPDILALPPHIVNLVSTYEF